MVALLFSEELDVVKVYFPACPAQEVTAALARAIDGSLAQSGL